MDEHLHRLATQMESDIAKQTLMQQVKSSTRAPQQRDNLMFDYLPASTRLQPRDFKPSYQRFNRLSSASSTRKSLGRADGGAGNISLKSGRSPKILKSTIHSNVTIPVDYGEDGELQ